MRKLLSCLALGVSKTRFFVSLFLGLFICGASAAPILVTQNDVLLGVKNVEFVTGYTNGQPDILMLDISFQDGSCVALYNGCNDSSDFFFSADGDLAAFDDLLQSIFEPITEQVFNPPSGFGFDGSKIRGCTTGILCNILLPTEPLGLPLEVWMSALTLYGNGATWDRPQINVNETFDTSSEAEFTYAVLTLSSSPEPVPAPAPLALLGLGLLILTLKRRHQ